MFRLRKSRFSGSLTVALVCGIALLLGAGCDSPPASINRPLTPQEESGHRVFEAYCINCHDPNSTNGRQGPGLQGLFRKQYLPSGLPANDERARDAILSGRRNMPPMQGVLDEQQLKDLLAYLHAL